MKKTFEGLIGAAINVHVSDIHMMISTQSVIKFRRNGRLEIYREYSDDTLSRLANYIRYISKIDLNFVDRPQTGRYEIYFEGQHYPLRISSLFGKNSDTLVIRILNNHDEIKLSSITADKKATDFLLSIASEDAGMFVISGATGSGKSTTLYAMLDEIHRRYNKNIISLEDPIEVNKDYSLQIELDSRKGITYQKALRQILRHDPDVIMIGEIRDQETAKLALTCALTGHLVLTTVHGSNCETTLKRLMDLSLSPLDVEDVLIGVENQKLHYHDDEVEVEMEYMTKHDIGAYLKKREGLNAI